MIRRIKIDNAFRLLRLIISFTAIYFFSPVSAQLCNGSLGDPVVDITFGSGGSGSSNYTPSNAYTYTSSTCPNDGYYTITDKTSGCFGNTWHTVTKDHTGNGNFMLVNASYEPGDFFVYTVTDLCPNTTYQFAAWILNMLNITGIRPNLTFTIETPDSVVLGQYLTGDIPEDPTPTWKEYGLYFTTPADNAVIVLRITNNAPGGNGNDLALDDITFRPCGPLITAMIQGNADTVNICEGNINAYNFNATVSSGFDQPVYQWQSSTDKGATWQDIPGANTLSYFRKPTTPGFYWYRLTITEQTSVGILACRVASNVVVINVHANPVVNAGPDRILITGTPITIQGAVNGESPAYYWSPPSYLSNDTILTPQASPPSDMGYTLFATSAFGCKNNDEMNVKVVAGIFVPNAFTPNGDGKNDDWRIPFLDPTLNATVNIYNRYGQLVYHADSKTVDWNGTFNGFPEPSGVYVYYIKFKADYPDMKGTLLLIR
ncbi:MAG TPA: gliding motility-associated C-terminal domain-containing protein [Parafilimonas sp.]|nr:gliding motility-associated C-terminal domain-containing protein [Parafilimonas sp.]